MRRTRVAVVGPDPAAHGGVAGVVAAILSSRLADDYELLPVSTYCNGTTLSRLAQAARGLARLALLSRRGGVDLVHVHTSWKGSFARKAAAVAIARTYRRPVVLHLHGTSFERSLRAGGLRGAFSRRAFSAVARRADALVAATPQFGAEVATLTGVRVSVVPNLPNVAAVERSPRRPPATVLYLGRLLADKGVFELVEAVAGLRRKGDDVVLVICGTGPAADELRRRGNELGLAPDALRLPGWVDLAEKRRLLATAWCLALPSYWPEGLPLAVLEAMISGVPVIATPVGGIPELIDDEREGLLVAPRDAKTLEAALARLLGDEALADRLAAGARRRAIAECSPGAVTERLAGLYETVLARARGESGEASTTSSSQRSVE